MELHGTEMIDLFAGRSAQFKELLANATLRTPDITFDQEAQLDLGGVTARLLWFGGAHTKGDELTFVEPDRTLVSGDVVQNKVVPGIFRDGGTPSSWLAVLDKVAALNALHVLPDHSAPGDGSTGRAGEAIHRRPAEQRAGTQEERCHSGRCRETARRVSSRRSTRLAEYERSGFVRSIYAE